MPASALPTAFRFRIDLVGRKPPVWRRLVLPAGASFEVLQQAIERSFPVRAAMPPVFFVHDRPIASRTVARLMPPGVVLPSRAARLLDVGLEVGDRFEYAYGAFDAEEGPRFRVQVEAQLTGPVDAPACLAGRGAVGEKGSSGRQRAVANAGRGDTFDAGRADAALAPLRSRRYPLPAVPSRLGWCIDEPKSCPLCGDEDVKERPWTPTAVDAAGHEMRPLLSGISCGACGAMLLSLGALGELLEEIDLAFLEVASFRWQGCTIPASVVLPIGGPVPWEEAWRPATTPPGPPPGLEEVQALPQSDETWQSVSGGTAWIGSGNDRGGPALGFAILFVAPPGLVRHAAIVAGPPDEDDVRSALLAACAQPAAAGAPARPSGIRVRDPALADLFAGVGEELDLRVEQGETPHADEALESLMQHGPVRSMNPTAVWWVSQSDADAQAFFAATRLFQRSMAWRSVPADLWLRVQVGDAPPHYLTLIGVEDDATPDVGYLAFDSWEDARGVMESHDDAGAVEALFGGSRSFESVSTHPLHALHPLDAAHLERLACIDLDHLEAVLPLHYSAQGPAPPRIPVHVHARILTALAKAFDGSGRDHRIEEIPPFARTVDVDGLPVRLQGPCPLPGIEAGGVVRVQERAPGAR